MAGPLIFRRSTKENSQLSDYLRTGSDAFIQARRRVTALYLAGSAAFGIVALYQMGLIKRVPEPDLAFLDADRVDASGEAYATLHVPDAILGIISYAITLMLVTSGGSKRSLLQPWLPIAAAVKVLVDVASGGVLTAEQAVKHRAFCSWCLGAAALPLVSLPSVLPEARAAVRGLADARRSRGEM